MSIFGHNDLNVIVIEIFSSHLEECVSFLSRERAELYSKNSYAFAIAEHVFIFATVCFLVHDHRNPTLVSYIGGLGYSPLFLRIVRIEHSKLRWLFEREREH